jgi:hypothetical protein
MATETLSDLRARQLDLAERALCQVRALLPLAIRAAKQCEDPLDDRLLGLLGRIDDMNHQALELLGAEDEAVLARAKVGILGAEMIHHG